MVKGNLRSLTIAFLLISFFQLSFFFCPPSIAKSLPESKSASKTRLVGSVNMLLTSCADAGVIIQGNALPTQITKVRLGSPAHYAGVCKGDQILDGIIESDQINLVIERGGKKYGIKLATFNKGLVYQKPQSEKKKIVKQDKSNPLFIKGNVENLSDAEVHKKLQQWRVVLFIDKSGSMNAQLPSQSTSKWNWLKQKISGFSQKAANAGSSNIDIVLFSSDYKVLKNCRKSDVEGIFDRYSPGGNTNLSLPMNYVLGQYQKNSESKPLLMAVITDGLINSGHPIEKTLINKINRMQNGKTVAITFLDISGFATSPSLLRMLDNELVSQGAKEDVVDTMYFNEINSMGLSKAIARAISTDRPRTIKQKNIVSAEMNQARKHSEAIRKRVKSRYNK